jgi:asparagine synthase (glutamine-hydrolysing)
MYTAKLAETLRSSVKRCIGQDDRVGLLFSGGVDSATLAVVARKFADVTLYLAGTPDSHDMIWGTEVGYSLDLPVIKIDVSKKTVLTSLEDLVWNHGLDNPRWMTPFIAFNIVAPKVKERLIMSGQGADELFGGYRKYAECTKEAAEKMMQADLEELLELETPLYRQIVLSMGKEMSVPFLDSEVAAMGKSLPFEEKLDGEKNKVALRKAARELGVPKSIAEHQKKAMQYGSGVSKILKGHLREVDLNLSELISQLKN